VSDLFALPRRHHRGDREVKRFVWRVFGYCLTGCTDEQVFFFIIGPGRTGKSVLANVLRELLGDYGLQADMKSFLIKKYDTAIPTDIARLRGARVEVASEANVNKQIDEALIKALTGGDPLVARFMRQNEFQFTPEFKLALVANDFPRVRRKDDAFWRRARVIPMNRVVPESEGDPGLQEKLRRELPGILALAARGCLSWQRNGLPLPPLVQEATERSCHMLHDRPHHLAQRWITYRRRSAVGDLFLGPYPAISPRYIETCAADGAMPHGANA
jgi:putative DNA primase/helicase